MNHEIKMCFIHSKHKTFQCFHLNCLLNINGKEPQLNIYLIKGPKYAK